MNQRIDEIRHTAIKHTRKATRLWVECKQVIESADGEMKLEAILSAIDLNNRAIEECRQAINKMDFIQRYRPAICLSDDSGNGRPGIGA